MVRESQIEYDIDYDEIKKAFRQPALGRGSYGEVYKWTWQNKDVAIKKLLMGRSSSPIVDRFRHEIHVMTQLDSPYTVKLYGACNYQDSCYSIVMEYMPAGSLDELLHSNAPLEWSVRTQLALDIGYGLAYLHNKKILHRDLKSMNVLLDTNKQAKLCDFGLAEIKETIRSQTTGTEEGKGTPAWMAPELFMNDDSSDDDAESESSEMKDKRVSIHHTFKSDVYSYGMVLWELATRQPPFKGKNQYQIAQKVKKGQREKIPHDCPEPFASLIHQCWLSQPKERPSVDMAIARLNNDRESPLTEMTTNNQNNFLFEPEILDATAMSIFSSKNVNNKRVSEDELNNNNNNQRARLSPAMGLTPLTEELNNNSMSLSDSYPPLYFSSLPEQFIHPVNDFSSVSLSPLQYLVAQLDGEDLVRLGQNQPEVIQQILTTPDLVAKLDNWDLARLGEGQPKVVQQILATPDLVAKLRGEDLARLGQVLEVAQQILATPHLVAKLDGWSLVILGQDQPKVAQRILAIPDLVAQLYGEDLVTLGQGQPEVAQQILTTPDLVRKLKGKDLVTLGQGQPKVAQQILTTPDLVRKLKGEDLATLGQEQLEMAQRILTMPDLVAQLYGEDLVTLGQGQPAVVQQILTKPDLVAKLDGQDLVTLGQIRLKVAQQILATPDLVAKLDDENLITLRQFESNSVTNYSDNPYILWSSAIKEPVQPNLQQDSDIVAEHKV